MDGLLEEIEAFCTRHEMSETRFGELAMGDKPFVGQVRQGRDLRSSTVRKVREFMASYRPDSEVEAERDAA